MEACDPRCFAPSASLSQTRFGNSTLYHVGGTVADRVRHNARALGLGPPADHVPRSAAGTLLPRAPPVPAATSYGGESGGEELISELHFQFDTHILVFVQRISNVRPYLSLKSKGSVQAETKTGWHCPSPSGSQQRGGLGK